MTFSPHSPQTSEGRSSNLQPSSRRFLNVGSKDLIGANRRMRVQPDTPSARREVRPSSEERSLSWPHQARSSDWSAARLASGERSLNCRQLARSSDWSEMRLTNGERSLSWSFPKVRQGGEVADLPTK